MSPERSARGPWRGVRPPSGVRGWHGSGSAVTVGEDAEATDAAGVVHAPAPEEGDASADHAGTPADHAGTPVESAAASAAARVTDPPPTWHEIAERYGDKVYTMAYRLTGDRDEANDLAQDVFVRVYRNLDRYRPGTFEGWLYRITKNLFLDRLRRRSRVRLEPLPDEEWRQPPEAGPGPEERAEAGVLRGDLEIALEQLPSVFRSAVVMCDVQGLSYEEISVATGWPIGTVRSRIHRGRRLLRTELDDARSRRG